MKKCNNCAACQIIKEGQTIKSSQTKFKIYVNIAANCLTANCIYMLGCKKCPQQYIGESERSPKERFLEHKGYVSNNMLNKATGAHFNQKGHRITDMEISVVEKIFNDDTQLRKQREKNLNNGFNLKNKGKNRIGGG